MKNFDELLDGVLREDASAEPRAGLEGRVMARVRAGGQRRSVWRFAAWGAVAAALPVCLIALLIWTRSAPPVQLTKSVHVDAVSVLPRNLPVEAIQTQKQRSAPAKPSVRQKRMIAARASESLPKLDVFPTPSVAAEPVRELAEIARRRKIVMGLAESSLVPTDTELKIAPITIAKIEIKPL